MTAAAPGGRRLASTNWLDLTVAAFSAACNLDARPTHHTAGATGAT